MSVRVFPWRAVHHTTTTQHKTTHDKTTKSHTKRGHVEAVLRRSRLVVVISRSKTFGITRMHESALGQYGVYGLEPYQ